MIVILDFGSQYTQLIARRIREQKVYCEIFPCNVDLNKIKTLNPEGIIFSGGPSSTFTENAPSIKKEIFEWGIPILGICYGLQLMVHLLDGKVEHSTHSEYGNTEFFLQKDSPLFSNFTLEKKYSVWMSHGDRVIQIPNSFEAIAISSHSPFAAISNKTKKLYGIQFHPEVTHTEQGKQVITNFLFLICNCKPDWNMSSYLIKQIEALKQKIQSKKVLCALSGGVDSSVVAVLLHQAIGNQLQCVFVDNGLLRKNEASKVVDTFKNKFNIPLIHIDAKERFLKKLKGITDPEQKRKIIGNEFIYVFEEQSEQLKDISFLAQGTLYPDVIESVSFKGPSATIKSHHNVGGLPDVMKLDLIEPLRELFKDEVRVLGLELNMPEEIIYRHPFPGPGLAVRIPGEISKEKIETLQDADAIVVEEIKQSGVYRDIWQAFAILLPIKSVGVMGDNRTYEWTIALRIVDSKDAMTANWTHLPYSLLEKISNRIINEVPKVNRVLYDITSKPPGTIEWE